MTTYAADDIASMFGDLVCDWDDGDNTRYIVLNDKKKFRCITIPSSIKIDDPVDLSHQVCIFEADSLTATSGVYLFERMQEVGILKKKTRAAAEVGSILMFIDGSKVLNKFGIQKPEELIPLFMGDLNGVPRELREALHALVQHAKKPTQGR